MRTAKMGDIFVLLTPSSDSLGNSAKGEYPWQRRLQQQYGGRMTKPVHVTLQRFVCPDGNLLTHLIDQLQIATKALPPLPLEAVDLRPLYSKFRETYILKCRVERTDGLLAFDETVRQTVIDCGFSPHIRNPSVLITVLEGIPKPMRIEPERLPTPMPLFTGSSIIVSRVIGREMYEMLHSWQIIP